MNHSLGNRPFFLWPACREEVIRLHGLGYSGARIARSLRCTNGLVCRWLKRLGLQTHGHLDPQTRQEQGERLRHRAARQAGGANPGTWMWQRRGVACLYLGWPGARTPADVTVLDRLCSGPATSQELRDAAGISRSGLNKVRRRCSHLIETVIVPSGNRQGVYRLAEGVAVPLRLLRQD